MSELMKRIMHPFTYKPPRATLKVNGMDTGMTPAEFGTHLRKLMLRLGVNPTMYNGHTASQWWYAQQFDPEDELG